jgi:hypothetical protein
MSVMRDKMQTIQGFINGILLAMLTVISLSSLRLESDR